MNTRAQPLLSLVKAGQQAIAQQDLVSAKSHLIEAARGLCQRAYASAGPYRYQQASLARRLYLQAMRLQDAQALPLPELQSPSALLLEDSALVTRAPLLDSPQPPSSQVQKKLDQIAGQDEIKRLFLSRYIYPLKHPELAKQYKQSGGGGSLLYGPPGTGKTMLARALAAEMGVPVVSINPANILSKWLGESEKQLADIFAKARQMPAALIFVDEIDALAPDRDHSESNGAMQRLLTQLLTELDGFHQNKGQLMFLAATNRPWDVDAALLRTGRFDSLAYVGLPDTATKQAILKQSLHGIPCQPKLDLQTIANQAIHFSGAEMCALAQLSARLAFLNSVETGQAQQVSQQHLQEALQHIHRAATPEMLARYQAFSGQTKPIEPPSGASAPIAAKQQVPEVEPTETNELEPSVLPPQSPINQPTSNEIMPLVEEATYQPLRYVSASDLSVELDTLPFVCYALQHTGIAPISQLSIKNNGYEASQNIMVEVALVPDEYGEPWVTNIAELKAGDTWQNKEIALPLKLERLRNVQEKERAHIRITLRDKQEILYARTFEMPVLAYNEWLFLPQYLQFTAAFVQPNEPALSTVIEKAANHLEKLTQSRAFSGYQQGNPQHVTHMLTAIHNTLMQDVPIDYINPPPSFERTGQKVRLVSETLSQGRGTCFDLAVLQAALWEHIGLYPCIVLVPGHALLACWLSEKSQRQAVTQLSPKQQASAITQAMRSGELVLVNSVEITAQQSFKTALEHGQQIVNHAIQQGQEIAIIDIQACRHEVTPLP